MSLKQNGKTAKDATLTFRLPEKLKSKAKTLAGQKKFRSTGEYVTALIEKDVEKKAA